jgi:hypothetical protein
MVIQAIVQAFAIKRFDPNIIMNFNILTKNRRVFPAGTIFARIKDRRSIVQFPTFTMLAFILQR